MAGAVGVEPTYGKRAFHSNVRSYPHPRSEHQAPSCSEHGGATALRQLLGIQVDDDAGFVALSAAGFHGAAWEGL